MSVRGPNFVRRKDLKAALKRAKPDDRINLEHCAVLWGVARTRFVNIRNDIEAQIGWPTPEPGPNRSYLYPARDAISKMLEWETRHDKIGAERKRRVDQILGRTARDQEDETFQMPINELATLNRLASDIEVRERDQRQYIPAAEVAMIAGEVFSMFTEYCGDLENRVDPNGLLPAEIRASIREGGNKTLLRIHQEMRDMLTPDANGSSRPAKTSRRANGRARGASPRR